MRRHSMPRPVLCDRCGAEADARWFDVTNFSSGAGFDYILGRCVCRTPGCVDWTGSASVPLPEHRTGLTAADRQWLSEHRQLIDEYGRVARALAAGAEAW